jgi:hypothetical protein
MPQSRLSRSETAASLIDLEIGISASHDLWRIALIKLIMRNACVPKLKNGKLRAPIRPLHARLGSNRGLRQKRAADEASGLT